MSPAQEQPPVAPIRPRSVSLGVIGDEPLGWHPTPSHYGTPWSGPYTSDGYWARGRRGPGWR